MRMKPSYSNYQAANYESIHAQKAHEALKCDWGVMEPDPGVEVPNKKMRA